MSSCQKQNTHHRSRTDIKTLIQSNSQLNLSTWKSINGVYRIRELYIIYYNTVIGTSKLSLNITWNNDPEIYWIKFIFKATKEYNICNVKSFKTIIPNTTFNIY